MGPDGAIAIAGALKENATLEKLVLIANSVGPSGVRCLWHSAGMLVCAATCSL